MMLRAEFQCRETAHYIPDWPVASVRECRQFTGKLSSTQQALFEDGSGVQHESDSTALDASDAASMSLPYTVLSPERMERLPRNAARIGTQPLLPRAHSSTPHCSAS